MMFNKLKKLRVSGGFMKMLLEKGEKHYKIVERVLPDDVKVVDIISDHIGFPVFWFILYSESWPELKDGEQIQEIESPIFDKIKDAT